MTNDELHGASLRVSDSPELGWMGFLLSTATKKGLRLPGPQKTLAPFGLLGSGS